MPGRYFVSSERLYVGASGVVPFRKISGAVAPANPGTLIATPTNFTLPDNSPNSTFVLRLSVVNADFFYTYTNWRRVSGFSKVRTSNIQATTCDILIDDADGLDSGDAGSKTQTYAVDYIGAAESGTLSVQVLGEITQTASPPPGGVWVSPSLTNPNLAQANMPTPVFHGQINYNAAANTCYDGRNLIYIPGRQGWRNPISMHGSNNNNPWVTGVHGGVITGMRAIDDTSRSMTWRARKNNTGVCGLEGDVSHDSDGLWVRINGNLIIEGCYFDNCMDAITLKQGGTGSYENSRVTVRHCYGRYLRDELVENDSCMHVTQEDILIDGVFMFYSERPGKDASATCPSPQLPAIFRRCYVEFKQMPYTRCTGSYHQFPFKMGSNTGPVQAEDCIFVMYNSRLNNDDVPGSDINMPGGSSTYSNCTMIWMGAGAYPGTLPSGWTLINGNKTLFNEARADWLSDHGDTTGTGDDFPWLHK